MHYCEKEKKKIEEEGRKSSPKTGLQVINLLQNWHKNLYLVIHTNSQETIFLIPVQIAFWLCPVAAVGRSLGFVLIRIKASGGTCK